MEAAKNENTNEQICIIHYIKIKSDQKRQIMYKLLKIYITIQAS
jgi:hypothetical protein